eukprot:COSAG04_NODE_11145_length_728_cov_0.739269_1_plen_86_part_10
MSCPLWHCLTHNMFDDRVQMYLQELPRAVATLTQVAVAQRRLSTFLGTSMCLLSCLDGPTWSDWHESLSVLSLDCLQSSTQTLSTL